MFNIAIDGTTSSGKSTLSGQLSKRLGFKRLDTGAIYRGIACNYKRRNLGVVNENSIAQLLKHLEIQIKFKDDIQHVIVNGIDETDNLRTEEISMLTSLISPYKKIREKVLSLQRDFAQKNDCVMEGRDITTVVLPNADVKFYVTATPEERAKRRYLQYKDIPGAPTFEEVLADLKLRDERDEHRQYGKLAVAKDAVVIDTTGKTLGEVTDICENIVRKIQKGKWDILTSKTTKLLMIK